MGCGVHYRSKYHSVLEKQGITIALAIDLKSQEETIRAFFAKKSLRPEHCLFLDESYRNHITVEEIERLVSSINLASVDAILIATEPKPRKSYALWAAHRKLDLFMDKPVTAFSSPNRMDTLHSDFEEIERAVNVSGIRAVVSCERRANLGYQWLKHYIRNFMDKEKIPLTSIDIHFAGGVWKTHREYAEDENHPFFYGYGVLLHSGYHFVDLLVTLLGLNNVLVPGPSKSLRVMASGQSGEVDFMMIGQATKEGRVATNFSLKLFGTSVSARVHKESKPKLEGRLRQESVILHFGHLCSIHVRSNPFQRLWPEAHPTEDFSITILHSPLLADRERIMTLNRSDLSEIYEQLPLSISMNTVARQFQLTEFLARRDGNSSLASHRETVAMLHEIYRLLKQTFPHQGLWLMDENKLCNKESAKCVYF